MEKPRAVNGVLIAGLGHAEATSPDKNRAGYRAWLRALLRTLKA